MLQRFAVHCLLLFLLILIGGCPGYDVKINEQVVYTIDPLFSEFEVTDFALHNCLLETIEGESITAADQLTTLNCSHAGIEDVAGLQIFSALTHLRLSSNRIRNLVDLAGLASLRELYLDNNRIVDPVPLYALGQLSRVDLSGNPDLQCPRKTGFAAEIAVLLPAHCK